MLFPPPFGKRSGTFTVVPLFADRSLIGYQKTVISYTICGTTYLKYRQKIPESPFPDPIFCSKWSTNYPILVLPLYINFKLIGGYCQYNRGYLRAFPCFYQFSQICFVRIAHLSPELSDKDFFSSAQRKQGGEELISSPPRSFKYIVLRMSSLLCSGFCFAQSNSV